MIHPEEGVAVSSTLQPVSFRCNNLIVPNQHVPAKQHTQESFCRASPDCTLSEQGQDFDSHLYRLDSEALSALPGHLLRSPKPNRKERTAPVAP